MKYQYCLQNGLDAENDSVKLVQSLYSFIYLYLMEAQVIPAGSIKLKTNGEELQIDPDLINVFKTESKYSLNTNYFELFILPNGALFISESYLHEILKAGGIEALSFILLNNLGHVIQKHVR